MLQYHHTVIANATPFRDFTERCRWRDNYEVEIQALRRQRLREWIHEKHGDVVLRFANSVKISQPQLADMLRGQKSFGEKIARRIEKLAQMPAGWLDADNTAVLAVREPRQSYHGVQITRAGALLAAEWEKLSIADRMEIETDIQARVAKGVRAKRRRDPDKPRASGDS